MLKRISVTSLILGLTLLGCGDASLSDATAPSAVSEAIDDGAHDGNEHFFFLPPMVPEPEVKGTFASDLEPIIEICIWTSGHCSGNIALFTTEVGSGSETVRIDTANELYVVNWHTDDVLSRYPLDESANEVYRIRVLVGAQLLGYADLAVVSNGKELRNVNTNEYIPLLDGRTLPIKFRVEEGFSRDPGGVSPGGGHTCAVRTDGTTYCWGFNRFGELGRGFIGGVSRTPAPVSGGIEFVAVSAGNSEHTCGISSMGDAYCWGFNEFGQLGDGTTENRSVPALVTGGHKFKSIIAGSLSTCGITDTGEGLCWGANAFGQLGNGTVNTATLTPTPVDISEPLEAIDQGSRHACGITTSQQAYCWGWDFEGAVGQGTVRSPTRRPTPTPISGISFLQIATGWRHTCGISAEQVTYCWGHNFFGEVGSGSVTLDFPRGVPTPTPVVGNHLFDEVAAGGTFSCGRSADGGGHCWGDNVVGQLGAGFFGGVSASPIAISAVIDFTAIELGFSTGCGVRANLKAYCWGRNTLGQVGDGTASNRSSPVFSFDLDAG